MEITDRQKTILNKIYDFIMHNSYPPTARDMAEIMGFSSPRAATDHFNCLEKKGYIKRSSLARSIKLTRKAFEILGQDKKFANSTKPAGSLSFYPYGPPAKQDYSGTLLIPMLGKIAAGDPILAYENIDEYIPVPESFTGAYGADFALRVRGNSMTGDHILDGDMIMVKAQNTAENGEIVVAMLNDEAVVKRFYKTENGVELASSNPDYAPIRISKKEGVGIFKIIGRVVAIHRNI